MRYYKVVEDGYIPCIGTGARGGTEITEEEYKKILAVIDTSPDGFYRLKEDLTWEEYTPEEPEEIEEAELLEI